jgi:hypothetical protein
VCLRVAVEQQHRRPTPAKAHAKLCLAGVYSRQLEAGEERQSASQTSSFCFVRRITSSVNSELEAWPLRSAVRTPSATASSEASRIARPASCERSSP